METAEQASRFPMLDGVVQHAGLPVRPACRVARVARGSQTIVGSFLEADSVLLDALAFAFLGDLHK